MRSDCWFGFNLARMALSLGIYVHIKSLLRILSTFLHPTRGIFLKSVGGLADENLASEFKYDILFSTTDAPLSFNKKLKRKFPFQRFSASPVGAFARMSDTISSCLYYYLNYIFGRVRGFYIGLYMGSKGRLSNRYNQKWTFNVLSIKINY